MAGGSGERFWPLSRQYRPKQLLNLQTDGKTLLDETIERIEPLIPLESTYVVTAPHLVEPIREGCPTLPAANVLAEPCKRNTAGCLAYMSAKLIAERGHEAKECLIAVLSADHGIMQPAEFRDCVDKALNAVQEQEFLGVIGIRPDRPETGYGYVEFGDEILPGVFNVKSFREKPSLDTAEYFLNQGNYYWNSGMFFWQLDTFLEELSIASPVHRRAIDEMAYRMRNGDEAGVQEVFESLPDISIDFALMEKSSRVAAIEGDFGWDDLGSWDSLYRSRIPDECGNVLFGTPIAINTKNCLVFDATEGAVAIGVVDVQGLAIVVTDDAVLVLPRERAQDTRKIVQELKRRGKPQV